jgi:phenol 2-monooxygenase (NADPH)
LCTFEKNLDRSYSLFKQVLDQCDGRPWHFQQKLKSDGRFRVVLFAGNILDAEQKARVSRFCAALDTPTSFLRRTGAAGVDGLIEVLTIHSAKRHSVELLTDFPNVLHPSNDKTGWSYHKIYCDDVSVHEGFGDAYANYGVDKKRGCVVVARPDQIVAWIGELEDFDDLQAYFEGCLILKPPANEADAARKDGLSLPVRPRPPDEQH